MRTKSIMMYLGTGGVTLSALAWTIYERTKMDSLLAGRTIPYAGGINNCILCNMQDTAYPFMVADDSYNTLASFYEEMKQNGIRVGVISLNSVLFEEMVKEGNGGLWFSACREGLYETYLPIMEKLIDRPTHIFVFDNDENIVKEAKRRCKNANIHIVRCILHSVCNAKDPNPEQHAVHLVCGEECLLVFPPEAREFRSLFKSNPFFGRAEVVFTDSEEQFKFYELWKPLGINVLHTLACVKAYTKGSHQGLTLDEIAEKKFSDVISEQEVLEHALRVYSLLYSKYLSPYTQVMQITGEELVLSSEKFLRGLFRLEDTVGRGLNPEHSSFDSKLARHFPYLRESGDLETVRMLDEFLKML